MNYYIFTDLDGTLLNHDNYSLGRIKNFINKIKLKNHIIFSTSKTFCEILEINKKLDLNFPFIVENGACIFFPNNYTFFDPNKTKFFNYKNYLGYKLSELSPEVIENKLCKLQKKYDFSLFSQLKLDQLSKITNLKNKSLINCTKRLFTNPIYWKDTDKKIKLFILDVKKISNNLQISKGGRFYHLSDHYNKGRALMKFLEIIKFSEKNNYKTISLGDSENDISMLEQTDYSCIVKREKVKISLNKNNNIYYSNNKAPDGWKESIEFILKKENKNS